MIVDPDFLEHWRTRMVVDALGGDELAPLYVMRVWGHCQVRKGIRFDMPSAGLKALCKFKGDAELLERAMVEGGFIERDGAAIVVPKWAEHNSQLIAAWKNGASGGRPKGSKVKPKGNPQVSGGLPDEDLPLTDPEAIGVEGRGTDDDDPRASAHAPTHEGATGVGGDDDFDDPTVAEKPGQWLRFFADRGHELDSTCSRTSQTLRAWVAAKVTRGEVRQALKRSKDRGKGAIGDLLAYIDTVIADQRIAAAKAASDARERGGGHGARGGDHHKAGAAVPTYEESLRAAAADAATKPDKAHLAEQARKAKAERDRIAAAKLAAAQPPVPAEGAQA